MLERHHKSLKVDHFSGEITNIEVEKAIETGIILLIDQAAIAKVLVLQFYHYTFLKIEFLPLSNLFSKRMKVICFKSTIDKIIPIIPVVALRGKYFGNKNVSRTISLV